MRIDVFLPAVPDSAQIQRWAINVLVARYNGLTEIPAFGFWQDDSGTRVTECVRILISYTTGLVDVERLWLERSFLPRLAEQYRLEATPQTCFLFTINNDPHYWSEEHVPHTGSAGDSSKSTAGC